MIADHPSYSQYVERAGEYAHLNRMVDVLELYKILLAGDGARFDQHFDDMLTSRDPGLAPRIITRLEEREPGLAYRLAPAERYPHSFAILGEMARRWDKSAFTAGLMGPSGGQFPLGERHGVRLAPDLDVDALTARFGGEHLVQFSGCFVPEVLGELAEQVARAPFRAMQHSSLGVDYTMDFGPTQAMLHYLASDTRLLRLAERIAGTPPIARFSGRVYRMVPSRDDDSYHSDVHLVDKRLVALSISLESTAPAGGELVMRRKGFLRSFVASEPAPLGNLVLFRISRSLEHKVARVRAGARTNLAGWYCPAPDLDYSTWVDRPLFAASPAWRRLVARR